MLDCSPLPGYTPLAGDQEGTDIRCLTGALDLVRARAAELCAVDRRCVAFSVDASSASDNGTTACTKTGRAVTRSTPNTCLYVRGELARLSTTYQKG